ncbi:MAG: hypothetical protein ABSB53_08275 [Nitrososphaerales archaeon]|jgi:hypothetical protein
MILPRTRKFYAILAAVIIASSTSIVVVYATLPLPPHKFVYQVNYICGVLTGFRMAPGVYNTEVIASNPSYQKTSASVTFEYRDGSTPGLSNMWTLTLTPDVGSIEIVNCNVFAPTGGQGYLTLYSSVKLDVVAHYTISTANGSSISTLSIPSQAFVQ